MTLALGKSLRYCLRLLFIRTDFYFNLYCGGSRAFEMSQWKCI